ncbi:hypothetical protein AAFC00_000444 [Neodothiora populina]|uniref:Uncharacterized protein n=1 Tax=Neodothiora populina TaxID=2781224 RepID=A0ABR3PCX1_9PEZI
MFLPRSLEQRPQLSKRMTCDYYGNCIDDDGHYSWTDYYVRYAVVAAIFFCIIVFVLGAYYHATRRIRRGLQPLPYHRWLVRRSRWDPHRQPPQQNTYAYYANNPSQSQPMYPMNGNGAQQQPPPNGWAPPPPAYGQHVWDTPPVYQPPPGASKASADQTVSEVNRLNGEGSSDLPPPAQTYQAPLRNEHIITQ